jgi:hypothetical protein
MKFFIFALTLIISIGVFANNNEYEFTEKIGLRPIQALKELTQDQQNKTFRENLEIRNEAIVRNRVVLIRMQNEMMLMERMRQILATIAEQEIEAPVILRSALDAADLSSL